LVLIFDREAGIILSHDEALYLVRALLARPDHVISAKVALPIHFFWPLRIQTSPSRRQVVNIPPDVAEQPGLSQAERADLLEAHHGRQPTLFLFLVAAQVDRPCRESCMHAQNVATDESTRASSIATKPFSSQLPPAALYPS